MERHPEFKTILKDAPLPIGDSPIAPFDEQLLQSCLASNGSYTCGYNIFVIDWSYSTCPSVPINNQSVGRPTFAG